MKTPCMIIFVSTMLLVNEATIYLPVDWRAQLLNLHNEARGKILRCQVPGQASARRMPLLQWHTGLETKAQQLANRCLVGHDTPMQRKIPSFRTVGQNWAGGWDLNSAFNSWFNEYAGYDFRTGRCLRGVCGHYTQLVWADTTHVGCGIRDCSRTGTFPYGFSIVCNYGPSGNVLGELPYDAGTQQNCYAAG
ncbi:unnamed protein product [Dicrocoelium dendriticum]|nr:unnamed protein product [Dicrocoelium dendriticum]CAH8514273.1 unnamed protein product [Dicrocoelium dendriticum]